MAAIAAAGLALTFWPSGAGAADPIEGVWLYSGGRVVVEPTGATTFKGTVSHETRLDTCPHPVGERMWEITKTGPNAYEGSHIWYSPDPCRPDPEGPEGASTWELIIVDGEQRLHFCTTSPDGERGPFCFDLVRAQPTLDEQPPNEAFLACGDDELALSLNDLVRTGKKRDRAKIAGFARSILAGSQVEIVGRLPAKARPAASTAATREVALGAATISAAGSFGTTVKLPGNNATIKKLRIFARTATGSATKAVNLTRRTRLTRVASKKGKTTVRGVLSAPRAKTLPKVTIERRVKCKGKKQWQKVATTKQKRNRTYGKRFPNPDGLSAVLRARTSYATKKGAKAKRTTATPYSAVELS